MSSQNPTPEENPSVASAEVPGGNSVESPSSIESEAQVQSSEPRKRFEKKVETKKREKPSQSKASRAAKPKQVVRDQKTEHRINKVLAAAGLGSRRQVDELIEQGRVEIDGKVITQVGTKVDPATARITVDGELLKKHRPVYFALNKPEGVLCTNRDPQGRPRVIDFVPNQSRLFPVGRLDASSTGLILLTNDGELAQRLAHPKHGIPKRYAVVVAGQVEVDALKRLQRGIYIAEGKTKVDHAKLKKVRKGSSELEITLSEGKNREIRRVLARLGHKVVSLQRIAIGPLKLSDLPDGAYRPLSNQEVAGLYEAVDEIRRARKAERKARKKLQSQSGDAPVREEFDEEEIITPANKAKRPGKPLSKPKPSSRTGSSMSDDFEDDEDDFGAEDNAPSDSILIRDSADPEAYDEAMEDFLSPKKRFGSVIGLEEFEEEDRVADATYVGFAGDDEEDFDDEYESDFDDEDFEEEDDQQERARGASRGGNRGANRGSGRGQGNGQGNGQGRSSGKGAGKGSGRGVQGSAGNSRGAVRGNTRDGGGSRGGIRGGSSQGGSDTRRKTARGGGSQGGGSQGGGDRARSAEFEALGSDGRASGGSRPVRKGGFKKGVKKGVKRGGVKSGVKKGGGRQGRPSSNAAGRSGKPTGGRPSGGRPSSGGKPKRGKR